MIANGRTVAIEENAKQICYSELIGMAGKVSSFLFANGFSQHSRIGILVDNVTDMVVCMIGAIQARCIFVPIDASLPEKRFKLIIEKSRPDVIIVSGNESARQNASSIRQAKLTDILEKPAQHSGIEYPDYQEDDEYP